MKLLSLILLALGSPAFAQQPELPPIDRELWSAMAQALGNVSMPLPAHKQVQQIMQNVEQEAAHRKASKDSEAAKAKPAVQ